MSIILGYHFLKIAQTQCLQVYGQPLLEDGYGRLGGPSVWGEGTLLGSRMCFSTRNYTHTHTHIHPSRVTLWSLAWPRVVPHSVHGDTLREAHLRTALPTSPSVLSSLPRDSAPCRKPRPRLATAVTRSNLGTNSQKPMGCSYFRSSPDRGWGCLPSSPLSVQRLRDLAGLHFPEGAAAADTPTSVGCARPVRLWAHSRAQRRAGTRLQGVGSAGGGQVCPRGHAGGSEGCRKRGGPRTGVPGAARCPPHKARAGPRPDGGDPGRFGPPGPGEAALQEWPHLPGPATSGDHGA